MAKTQYYTATSLDGFIADEEHSLDWLFEVERGAGAEQFAAFFAAVGAMACGSNTYEWVLEHDRLLDNPEKWRGYYGDTPCWVFTHRDLPAVPGADIRFVSGDVRPVHEEMTRLARGKDIWLVGGGDLVGQFADHGLLDELLVQVAPVTLGGGAPLLPRRLGAAQLELVEISRNGQLASLSYRLRQARRGDGGPPAGVSNSLLQTAGRLLPCARPRSRLDVPLPSRRAGSAEATREGEEWLSPRKSSRS